MGVSGSGISGVALVVDGSGDLVYTNPSGTATIISGGVDNAGTAGTGTTAVEYGDGYNHVTKLTLAGVLPDIAGTAAEAEGLLIYTLPAGVILVEAVHMSVSITQTEGFINADTPEVGIGSAIATGAIAVLNGGATPEFEDYITGTAAANCTGTATELSTEATGGGSVLWEAGGSHLIHLNVADTWAASGDAAATVTGTVWVVWRFLGA